MMNNTNNNNLLLLLPAEITIDILSRLPIESVLQCKLVCKTWHTSINDPVFGQTHTDRSLLHLHHQQQQNSGSESGNNTNNISFGFFLCKSREGIGECHFSEYKIHHHDLGCNGKEEEEKNSSTFKVKKWPFPSLDEHSHNYDIGVGSCNGLICLVNSKDDFNVCVYNPLTREYVNLLPRFNISGTRSGKFPLPCTSSTRTPGYVATGFGYHPGTKEYKIVRIYYETICCSSGQVSLYTLGSGGGWRSKGETSHIMCSEKGVYANGALHWLTNRMLVGVNQDIVSFDLIDEEFRIIPSPPPNVMFIELGVLEGCLSVIGRTNCYSPEASSDVWVLVTKDKDDHDKYRWSKKYNIPWNDSGSIYNLLLAPLLNKILLHYLLINIISFKTKRGCLDDNVHTMELLKNYELFPYMKSFASLKALGEDGARIERTTASPSQKKITAAENLQMKGKGKGKQEQLLKKKKQMCEEEHMDTQAPQKKSKVDNQQYRDVSSAVLGATQVSSQNLNAVAGNGTRSEKVHKCKEKDCGKSFATGSALGGHMSSHRKCRKTLARLKVI